MPKAKYFRTVVSIEILSNEEIPDTISLEDISYGITYGHWSGLITHEQSQEIKAPKARRLLQKQGSDPTFLDNPS